RCPMRRYALLIVAAGLLVAADAPKEKEKDKEEAVKKELKKLDGTWKVTGGKENGKALQEDFVKALELIIKDGTYSFRANDVELEQGKLKPDLSKKPKQLDIEITAGNDKDKTQVGIYELDGDTFKLCVARPGEKERPKEFDAKEDSNHTLFELKREKP